MKNLITNILAILVLNTTALSAMDAEELREHAREDFQKFDYEEIILEYIDCVIEDGILDNPEEYLTAWILARGNTLEHRIPEDPARYFFCKYLLN